MNAASTRVEAAPLDAIEHYRYWTMCLPVPCINCMSCVVLCAGATGIGMASMRHLPDKETTDIDRPEHYSDFADRRCRKEYIMNRNRPARSYQGLRRPARI